jgi:hypothetical protein
VQVNTAGPNDDKTSMLYWDAMEKRRF